MTLPAHRNLLFVAGDLSGDIHTARLAREVLRRHPQWTLHALGGLHLRDAIAASPVGEFIGDTSGTGVIGFVSALSILPRVARLHRATRDFLRAHHLDAAVLCDWGGFNSRLLPHLKQQGIPVLYYFPPRSWQKTGTGGINIAPFVDHVATPFEWSAQRLNAAGCRASWVGHPLLERLLPTPREELRREFGVTKGETLVTLLPGSRALELRYIAPHVAEAVELLSTQYAATKPLRFLVAVPEGATNAARRYFPSSIPIVEGRSADALMAADAAIVKSGTATLEAAVAGVPQVVVYDVPAPVRAQWVLTGMQKKAPLVAMPNIILERMAVPELVTPNCKAELIARAVTEILEDAALRERIQNDYIEVRRALGSELPGGATNRTADILDEMLGSSTAATGAGL
jgi:lipid-A-disaccharide synthase